VTLWESRYTALLAYVDREGHALVTDGHMEDDVPLGGWVSAQRSRHRRGKLSAERTARLEAVPGWVWDAVAHSWEDGFGHLETFLAREGHLRVQAHHVEPDGYPLGSWVRSHRRRGGRRTMTDEQQRRLEALPGWSYDFPVDQHWERAYAALNAFAVEHGHCRAPRTDDLDLRGWVGQQRQKYKAGTLEDDRVERLEQIRGWSWDPQTDAWETGYDALLPFAAREGHARVRSDHLEAGYPLGAWVAEQRISREELTDDRRARLEAVEGWSWAPHEDRWEAMYALLEQFVAREGHAGVPTGHLEDGEPLGQWIIWHRGEHKRGRVRADRVTRLEALPGWMWDTREARWEAHYAALRDYADRHGHARVPSEYEDGDGMKLGKWVVVQRATRKRGELTAERVRRLEQVPGWVWNARRRAAARQDATVLTDRRPTDGSRPPGLGGFSLQMLEVGPVRDPSRRTAEQFYARGPPPQQV
jgi:hypothetical protein